MMQLLIQGKILPLRFQQAIPAASVWLDSGMLFWKGRSSNHLSYPTLGCVAIVRRCAGSVPSCLLMLQNQTEAPMLPGQKYERHMQQIWLLKPCTYHLMIVQSSIDCYAPDSQLSCIMQQIAWRSVFEASSQLDRPSHIALSQHLKGSWH